MKKEMEIYWFVGIVIVVLLIIYGMRIYTREQFNLFGEIKKTVDQATKTQHKVTDQIIGTIPSPVTKGISTVGKTFDTVISPITKITAPISQGIYDFAQATTGVLGNVVIDFVNTTGQILNTVGKLLPSGSELRTILIIGGVIVVGGVLMYIT